MSGSKSTPNRMPFIGATFAALAVAASLPLSAGTLQLVTNGNFEAGTSAVANGWAIVVGSPAQRMVRSNAPLPTVPGNYTFPVAAVSGYSMMSNQTTVGAGAAFQIFTIPNACRSLSFSASIVGNVSSASSAPLAPTAADIVRVDILPASANPLTGTPIRTLYLHTGAQGNQALTTVSDSFSGLAGQQVMLRFWVYAQSNPVMFALDDVSLLASLASVYGSSKVQANSIAYGAAQVIDATPALQNLFSAAMDDSQTSQAATQTLPLLQGAMPFISLGVLSDFNHAVQARQDGILGRSADEGATEGRNVWMKPFGSWASQSDQGSASGYRARSTGLMVGSDRAISETSRLGIAFLYAHSLVSGEGAEVANDVSSDLYQLTGYSSTTLGPRTALEFQGGLGIQHTQGHRSLSFTASTASASYMGVDIHLGTGLVHDISLAKGIDLACAMRMDYTCLRDDGYSEAGAGALNLDVDGRSTQSLVTMAEARLTETLGRGWSLRESLGLGHDFMASQSTITASFQGAPGQTFATGGIAPGSTVFRGGFGVAKALQSHAELSAGYDIEMREGYRDESLFAKARWVF